MGTIILLYLIGIPKVVADGAMPIATTTTLYAPTTTVPPLVPAAIMAKWQKVAWCETHANWHYNGSRYDGGLGIIPRNWIAFGGQDFAPAAHLATPEQQVYVAIQIQTAGGVGSYVPDQYGTCRAW